MSDKEKEGCVGSRGPKEVGDWSGVKKVSTNAIMKYFNPDRLPEEDESKRNIVGIFQHIAEALDEVIPDSAEKSAGLRKLLEAQDCILRAAPDA